MKTLFILALFLLCPFSVFGQVHIDIKGVEANTGSVVVTVWETKEKYLEEAFLSKRVEVGPVSDGTIRVSFEEDLPEQCAINVYYDKNGNGKLDTNLFRIPKEPVGITNDVKGKFGPPKFKDSTVTITGEEQVFVIQLGKP